MADDDLDGAGHLRRLVDDAVVDEAVVLAGVLQGVLAAGQRLGHDAEQGVQLVGVALLVQADGVLLEDHQRLVHLQHILRRLAAAK